MSLCVRVRVFFFAPVLGCTHPNDERRGQRVLLRVRGAGNFGVLSARALFRARSSHLFYFVHVCRGARFCALVVVCCLLVPHAPAPLFGLLLLPRTRAFLRPSAPPAGLAKTREHRF